MADNTATTEHAQVLKDARELGERDAARANAFLDGIRKGNPGAVAEPQFAAVVLNNYVAVVMKAEPQ